MERRRSEAPAAPRRRRCPPALSTRAGGRGTRARWRCRPCGPSTRGSRMRRRDGKDDVGWQRSHGLGSCLAVCGPRRRRLVGTPRQLLSAQDYRAGCRIAPTDACWACWQNRAWWGIAGITRAPACCTNGNDKAFLALDPSSCGIANLHRRRQRHDPRELDRRPRGARVDQGTWLGRNGRAGNAVAVTASSWMGPRDRRPLPQARQRPGVLEACRSRDTAQRVVVLSNYATTDMRKRCMQLGADAVFDKSNEIDALVEYCILQSEASRPDA